MSSSTNTLTPLYTAADIDARVREMAAQINACYTGESVLLVGVLKGAFIFCADLARQLTMPLEMDFARLASYGTATSGAQEIKFTKDVESPLAGKHVLIVEDIVDTGRSMAFLCAQFAGRGAKSVKLAAFVDKPERRQVPITVNFTGFHIDSGFIVGYGLDYAEHYRELPGLHILNIS